MPKTLRGQILDVLCAGHHVETKYLLLARKSVFWPGITNDIKTVKDCDKCNIYQPEQPMLPLIQPDLSSKP